MGVFVRVPDHVRPDLHDCMEYVLTILDQFCNEYHYLYESERVDHPWLLPRKEAFFLSSSTRALQWSVYNCRVIRQGIVHWHSRIPFVRVLAQWYVICIRIRFMFSSTTSGGIIRRWKALLALISVGMIASIFKGRTHV